MRWRVWILILGAPTVFVPRAVGGEFSMTVAPAGRIDYRGEGKILPQGYVNRFESIRSPLIRWEWKQTTNQTGYWGLTLWHTGVSVGGDYGVERLPDVSSGTYQTSRLNVGYTNVFATYHRPLARGPLEAQVHLSVVREIFKRERFAVKESASSNVVVSDSLDDVNELSAEGVGLGLSGRHGNEVYVRWQTAGHYYVQLFDSKTDASAGSLFEAEAGVGWRFLKYYEVEAGALWSDWFILGQGDRRLSLNGTDGAVISYNRNKTVTNGAYLRIGARWGQ